MSLFVLKYSPLEATFGLYDTLIHLHIYCFTPHFPSYTFIWPYMFISFLQIFLPTRLFRPTLVLGTLVSLLTGVRSSFELWRLYLCTNTYYFNTVSFHIWVCNQIIHNQTWYEIYWSCVFHPDIVLQIETLTALPFRHMFGNWKTLEKITKFHGR